MSVLQYILSLQGPRGEQRGKALSGADFVCAVANPSTPTKQKAIREGCFLFCGSILPSIFTFPPHSPPFDKGRGFSQDVSYSLFVR